MYQGCLTFEILHNLFDPMRMRIEERVFPPEQYKTPGAKCKRPACYTYKLFNTLCDVTPEMAIKGSIRSPYILERGKTDSQK